MVIEGTIVDEKAMASPDDDSPMELTGSDEEISENIHTDSETETSFCLDETTQHAAVQTDQEVVDNLGRLFEHCIQQVSRLEGQRDELIRELLRLQEPLLRVLEHLRAKVVEAQKLLVLTKVDYKAVFEEVQQVKKKLFAAARDCIQSQVTLAAQEYEVAQSAVTQDELKTHIQNLTQELSQLQDVHKNQLNTLRDQSRRPPCRARAMSDVSQCRQASVRLQRRLSGSLRALEGWYEPRVLALLKRRQLGEEALRRCREQAGDLKSSLEPLREECQKLEVQRSSLQQRICLMEQDREDSITRHKETVETLRETLRELELEFEVQRNAKTNLEHLKDGLLTELTFLRGRDEDGETSDEEEA